MKNEDVFEGRIVNKHFLSIGDNITLVTSVYLDGDEEDDRYADQEITVCTTNIEFSIGLSEYVLTPRELRKLADDLEKFEKKVNFS